MNRPEVISLVILAVSYIIIGIVGMVEKDSDKGKTWIFCLISGFVMLIATLLCCFLKISTLFAVGIVVIMDLAVLILHKQKRI